MKRHLLLLVLLLLPAAAAGEAPPPADPNEALAAEAQATAIRVRRLVPTAPIRTKVASRPEIERYVVGRIEDTGARCDLELNAAALAALGAVPAGYDLVGFMLRVSREQIAGYYDFERKTLFVADWLPRLLQGPTLVHETVHALQDQAFDIGRFMKPMPGCSEASGALAAVLEGDATLAMLEAMTPGGPAGGEETRRVADWMQKLSGLLGAMSGLGDVPRVVRDSLFFPYVAGLKLVAGTRARGGWAAVDALYRAPPLSTEQVLHPEKLAAGRRDDPRDVALPATAAWAGPGWRLLGTDILGEYSLRRVLAESLPEDRAEAAAAGWDGDRYAAWTKGPKGPYLLAWASVWDSEAEAVEAAGALAAMTPRPVVLERRKERIVALWGEPGAGVAARIAAAAWAGFRTTDVRDLAGWERVSRRLPKACGATSRRP